jgi:ABC-type antimicrobial peptide transport system permease subunit
MLGKDVPLGPMSVSLFATTAASATLVVFGALAGVIPAYHAGKIQPVEALRTE